MIEKEDAEIIAKAIIASDIINYSVEQLGELSMIHYENDPDVEFVDLDFTPDAGELHGVNTEEEMMQTLGDE